MDDDAVPVAGGSYLRDPVTGELIPLPINEQGFAEIPEGA